MAGEGNNGHGNNGHLAGDGQDHRPNPKYPPSRTKGLKPPWPPGYCPNPGGKIHVHQAVTKALRDALEAKMSPAGIKKYLRSKEEDTGANVVAKSTLAHIVLGSDKHLGIVLDRLEGPLEQKVDLTTQFIRSEVQDVTVRIINDDSLLRILDATAKSPGPDGSIEPPGPGPDSKQG